MRKDPSDDRWSAALLLDVFGVLILGVVAVYSIPLAIDVLRDPASHQAEDAGMTAILLLIPMSVVGIGCLLLAFLLWMTRAGAVLLTTAVVVVTLVALDTGGFPALIGAIAIAIAGVGLALSFVYLDWTD